MSDAGAAPASPAPPPATNDDDAVMAGASLFVRPAISATSKFTTARTAAGRLAPTLVLDLDDTVLYRSRGALDALLIYGLPATWAARAVGVPYPGALEAVHDLAAHFRIVALTARWSRGAAYTREWLSAHGLPELPVIVAARPHPGDDSRVAFKAAAIDWLARAGWAPIVGVGDRPSDLAAYAACGLHAAVVAHMPPPPTAAAVSSAGATGEVDPIAAALPPPPAPSDAAGEEACWKVLRRARRREAELTAAAAAQAAGSGGASPAAPSSSPLPRVTYFTDAPSVHAAVAAAPASADGGEVALGGGGSRGLPPLRLYRPPPPTAATAATTALAPPPPPVWSEGQLRGWLKRLAAEHAGGNGSDEQQRAHIGGADWEEEATAPWFVKGVVERHRAAQGASRR